MIEGIGYLVGWIGQSVAVGRRMEGGRRLFESLRQLAAKLGDEIAQRGDGAGRVGVWRRALARETGFAGLESLLPAR